MFFFSTGAECSGTKQVETTQEQTSDPFQQIDQENKTQVPIQEANAEASEEKMQVSSPEKKWYQKVDLEARFAIFIPQSSRFQDIYGYLNPSLQLELTFSFQNNVQWWSNFSYLLAKGDSDPLHVPTTLKVYSISTGAKYVFCFPKNVELSLGAGLMVNWLRETNQSMFMDQAKEKSGVGGILKLEATKIFNKWLVSFFMDYQFQTFSAGSPIEDVRIDLSGLYLGLSLGYRF